MHPQIQPRFLQISLQAFGLAYRSPFGSDLTGLVYMISVHHFHLYQNLEPSLFGRDLSGLYFHITKTPHVSVRRPVFLDKLRFVYSCPSTKPSRENPEVVVMDIVPKPCLYILGGILCQRGE